MTENYIGSLEAQIIGRVFTYDDTIHFVLGTDRQTGMARCSRRTSSGPGICYLAMADIQRILITESGPNSDNLGLDSPASENQDGDILLQEPVTSDDNTAPAKLRQAS